MAKKPTGLTIARNGEKFTITWKRAEKYTAQQLNYKLGRGKWYSVADVKSATTSKSITLSKASYYPNTATKVASVSFRVRGKYNKKWSDWNSKTFTLYEALKPSLTAALDDELSNVTKFSWKLETSTTSGRMFTDIEWQTRLVKDCKTTDGSTLAWNANSLGWATGTSTSNDSYRTVTEDTAILHKSGNKWLDSYTRWFRVRSRGHKGPSDWSYAKHVYSTPYQSGITKINVTDNTNAYVCTVTWTSPSNTAKPIEKSTVEYLIDVPAAGMAAPDGNWTTAVTIKDTLAEDAATFTINKASLATDKCLFVRVNNEYDGIVREGIATLAKAGTLANPTNLSVNAVPATHRATISAENNSEVPDSFLVVKYRTSRDNYIIGIIEHGDSSVTVQCPDWGEESPRFEVYAAVGTFKAVSIGSGLTKYDVTQKMRSANTLSDGGAVPIAPTGVTATAAELLGTVLVEWNWSWSSASSAVISWADHEDAWESTDEPQEYTVSNLYASRWNITGLETGKRWYIRVKLVDASGTSGPWSDMQTVDLTSAPTKPELNTTKAVVTEDEKFAAYWAFVSADGTGQGAAVICEATITDGVVSYGTEIFHVKSAQSVEVDPKVLGWIAGQTKNLCLKVTSEAGKESSWSNPVSVMIADKLTASITSTSLVGGHEMVNPRDYEGAEITIVTPDVAPIITAAEADVVPAVSGTGTPTPTNIKHISGYENVVVYDKVGSSTPTQTSVALGRKVYSGHLDITNGTLTVDKVMIEFDGTENWEQYGESVGINLDSYGVEVADNVMSDRYSVGDTWDNLNMSIDSTDNLIGYGKIGSLTIRR